MELENYRNFLTVIEAGSIADALECTQVEQPAISKQIKALEKYFGSRLL